MIMSTPREHEQRDGFVEGELVPGTPSCGYPVMLRPVRWPGYRACRVRHCHAIMRQAILTARNMLFIE